MKEVISISLSGLSGYLTNRAYMRTVQRIVPKKRYTDINLLGNLMNIDRHDLEQMYLETDCVREPENIFMYRALANSGLCTSFIDIGANYGHVASKIYQYYKKVVLIDANPNAATFLRKMFSNQKHVDIKHCALVGDPAIETVTLLVPEASSGLAHLSTSKNAFHTTDEQSFECEATTLDNMLAGEAIDSAYVKIDVEGLEYSVIQGGGNSLKRNNVIVGFEALSHQVATECCSLFPDHTFFFGRFDFLTSSGALTKSVPGVLRSIVRGGNIVIYKFTDISEVPLENFSQIVAVPTATVDKFENALRLEHEKLSGKINLSKV